MSSHSNVEIFATSLDQMELGSGKSLKSCWSYISSVDLFSLPAVLIISLWSSWRFLVQTFIFLFIAVAEAMERLLIKRFFGKECPREAYIKKIKAWIDCNRDRTNEENLMHPQSNIWFTSREFVMVEWQQLHSFGWFT